MAGELQTYRINKFYSEKSKTKLSISSHKLQFNSEACRPEVGGLNRLNYYNTDTSIKLFESYEWKYFC